MGWIDIADGVLRVLSGLLTPVIGVIAVYIAYQQHKTNKDKLRLELYGKRLKVYQALSEFIGRTVRQGDVDDESLYKFLRETAEANFLFGAEMGTYLHEIYLKAIDLQYLEKAIKNPTSPVGEKREAIYDKRQIVFDWFKNQFNVAQEKFGKQLRFE